MVKLIYRSVLVVGLVWFVTASSYAQSGETPSRPQTLRLANMQAMLFFENTGKFSPDVFTNQVNLWNTPIEGASREGASESTLVVVEIKAEGEGLLPGNRKVELTARYRIADKSGHGKPAFFRKTMTINIGSDYKFFAAFWLYETGCHPVELTARIVGQRGSLRKKINFGCGE
ncbi:MAG: hypothetical protein WAQ99_21620 [Pyrinomonadaceae bacterium]